LGILILIALILDLAVIWLTMEAARQRHRSPVAWGFLAVWTSVLALIPLVLLGESKAGKRRFLEAEESAHAQAEARIEAEEETRMRARRRVETEAG
jgi:hypothetical protein